MRLKHFQSNAGLSVIASIGVFLLFIFFYLYHYGVANFGVPPILGGVFGWATVLLCFAQALFWQSIIRRGRQGGTVFVLFLVTISYVLLWSLCYFYFGDLAIRKDFAIEQVYATVFGWVSLFVIGMYIDFDGGKIKKISILFVAVVCFFTVINFGQTGLLVDGRQLVDSDDVRVATYQGLARSLFVVGIFLIATEKSRVLLMLFFLVVSCLIFVQGARSEFLGFLLAGMIRVGLEVLGGARAMVKSVALVAGAVICIVIAFGFVDELGGSRQLEVFDLSNSTSWVARLERTEVGLKVIRDNPIIGSFGSNVTDSGDTGSYAHNVLSAWVSFGAVGFFLYLSLCLMALFYSIRNIRRRNAQISVWRAAFLFNASSIFLLIFSQSVFWVVPALGWGLVVNGIASRNQERKFD